MAHLEFDEEMNVKRATRNLALTVASVLMTMSWLATAQDGGPGVVSVRLVDVRSRQGCPV